MIFLSLEFAILLLISFSSMTAMETGNKLDLLKQAVSLHSSGELCDDVIKKIGEIEEDGSKNSASIITKENLKDFHKVLKEVLGRADDEVTRQALRELRDQIPKPD